MKPLKLSMTAFGPYREKEVIDFTELNNNRIFVISGATGAGKTTIFDGICYALYGSVSGEERDNAGNVRSDFAEDQLHTAIELIFEMKGKKYRILRQLAHVKKGNKTATGEKNEFVELVNNGGEEQEVPVLDSHRVRDMNLKLESIIGLTQDQFKQIVMLPQGEFRKLLTSDSQNKGDILRKIFKTEDYKKMADRLKVKKTQAESELAGLENEKNIHFAAIKDLFPARDSLLFEVLNRSHKSTAQILEGLDEELAYYREQEAILNANFEKAKKQTEDSRLAYTTAEQFNKDLQKYNLAEVRNAELIAAQPQIDHSKQILQQAEKAEHIIPYETNYRKQNKVVQTIKAELVHSETAVQQAKVDFELAKEQLEIIQNQQTEQEERKKQLAEWQRIHPLYEELTTLEFSYSETLKRLQQSTAKLAEKEQLIQTIQQTGQKDEVLKSQWQAEISNYDELLQQKLQLEKIEQHVLRKQENERVAHSLSEQIQVLSTQFEAAKAQQMQLETTWLSNQAYVLATQLVEGNPCPVCGSLIHEKMHNEQGIQVTREMLEQAKNSVDTIEKQGFNYTAQLTNAKQIITDEMATLETFNDINYNELTIRETIVELQRQLSSKQQLKVNLQELEVKLANLRTSLDVERQNYTAIQQQTTQLQFEEKQQQFIIAEKRKQLPTQFESKNQLEFAMNNIQGQMQAFEDNVTRMKQNYDLTNQQFVRNETSLLNKQNHLTEQLNLEQQAQDEFKEKVLSAGFADGKSYTEARLVPEEVTRLKNQLDEFAKELYAIGQQLVAGKELYEHKQAFDLQTLSQQLQQQILEVESISKKQSNLMHLLTSANRLFEQLKAAQVKMEQLEIRAGQIIKLFDLLSGKNEQKISFERYLQIEYLEQIIQAANKRLIPLSNGQYKLLRSARLDGNGKQSGLSLDVYDTYTGQERDVKTLSGGEQFNASLCLALGMSDIIQSFKGNVHMDTMFIDEGFGTLDEEALAKAINTLVDLQKTGRMIGIISHVAELKETIPATLEVRKSKEGFSHTKFIIK